MKQEKKDQNPKPQQDEKQRRPNTPGSGQQQTPGKAQDEMPPKHHPPRPTDVDEEDQELDPRQRRPA